MNWNKILVVFLTPMVLSCGAQKKAVEEMTEHIEQTELILVQHDIVAHGALYGGGEEQIQESTEVINTPQEWEALKAKMNSINNVSEGFKIREIDFDNYTVIACFDKVRPSGGFSIKVKTITESATQITVYLDRTTPEMPATSVLTQPYEIVLIEKTNDLPVVTQ